MSEIQAAKNSAPAAQPSPLPDDFQDRVFKAIAVQRPAVTAYIKEVRRKRPDATPAEVMKTIEAQYVASTTIASSAIGASAAIPAVGIPIAIGLGVADLLFFYESTALFALCMAELRGIPVEDPERAKAIVLGAMLGEKRKSKVTEIVMSALPAGAAINGARGAAGVAMKGAAPGWGDLLAQQLPDSALVPVSMVLAKQAIAQGATMGIVKIGSKAIPVIGAVAGGATSFYFGSGVVKSCRAGFSEPAETWPAWLEPTDADGDGLADPPRSVVAMRAAAEQAKDFGENVWSKVADSTSIFRSVDLDGDGIADEARALTAVKGAASAVGEATTGAAAFAGKAASGAAGAVAGMFKRDKAVISEVEEDAPKP